MGAYNRLILELAEKRGYSSTTFATKDELSVPGYNEAWKKGHLSRLIADAIAGIYTQSQHGLNLSLYSLLEAQRLLGK